MTDRSLAYLCLQATTEGQASHAHVHEIISGLRELGWHVDLFEPAYAGRAAPGVFGRLAEFRRVQRRLVRALREGSYDALYVRGHPFAWPAARAARRFGVPAVQECNGPYDDLYVAWPSARPLRPIINAMARAQYRWATARIAVTPELAGWIERETGRAAEVIGNGANDRLFVPGATPPSGLTLPARYAVLFGALAPWQGIETALAAAADEFWPGDVALLIVGDGALRPAVNAASSANPTRLVALGTRPYAEMPGILAGALCSLVLSGRAGEWGLSPLKLYESMASGVPVIVPERAGSATTVREHDSGMIVPPDDATAVAVAVAALAADPVRAAQMGRRGRAAVEAHYSWSVRARATAAVLDTVLERSV